MYMLNMVIILIVMYCNVVTAIDKIPTYLLRFNIHHQASNAVRQSEELQVLIAKWVIMPVIILSENSLGLWVLFDDQVALSTHFH